jgi:Flp pilus assembly protein TadB
MSRERAVRRAAREREQAIRAAARAREEERRQRVAARRRSLTGRLPGPRRRTPGVLEARRRRQVWVTVAVLLAVNVVVWVVSPDWALRTVIAMVSLLAAPVLYTLLFRRT